MTDRHDPPWDPEDDELVRAALMSLMDDVRDEPLPEPAFIRARAEGSRDREHDATGTVVELGRRRRRTFAVVAGVAAAALVATSAALIVVDRPGTAPAGTTTVTATDDAITLLDSQEWSAALGLDVTSTRSSADPQGQCFQTPESGSWDRRVSTLADGRVIAGQWIGTSTTSTDAPTDAVDEAVARCEETYTVSSRITEQLPLATGDASYRSWHATGPDGSTYWWVEASRGRTTTFLTVAEVDGMTYSSDQMRNLAKAALGDVDLVTDTGWMPGDGVSTTTGPDGAEITH